MGAVIRRGWSLITGSVSRERTTQQHECKLVENTHFICFQWMQRFSKFNSTAWMQVENTLFTLYLRSMFSRERTAQQHECKIFRSSTQQYECKLKILENSNKMMIVTREDNSTAWMHVENNFTLHLCSMFFSMKGQLNSQQHECMLKILENTNKILVQFSHENLLNQKQLNIKDAEIFSAGRGRYKYMTVLHSWYIAPLDGKRNGDGNDDSPS